jgi:hypothetical protein
VASNPHNLRVINGGQDLWGEFKHFMIAPPWKLADLDAHAVQLQVNFIECSTSKNYATGA